MTAALVAKKYKTLLTSLLLFYQVSYNMVINNSRFKLTLCKFLLQNKAFDSLHLSTNDYFTNMLSALQELFNFTPDKEGANNQLDIKLAAATLMFELIRADGNVDPNEVAHMREILVSQFALDNNAVDRLCQLAEENAIEAISLHAFTREICEQWDNSKRVELLENLWFLALSDEIIDSHERHLVRKIANLLYLNETEIIQTRERARQRVTSELSNEC